MIVVIAEKMSLAEALANELPGKLAQPWDKSLSCNQVGEHVFVWLDGHAFKAAMPDHYLPADLPTSSSGTKVWRKADLPIIPKVWVMFPDERKHRRLNKLEELLKTCTEVWHVGDPDEEGQLLVDEALSFYRYRGPVRRVLISDYNASKVRQAIAEIRDNSEPMFRSWHKWALARSRYDWLVGLNCTRAMTLRGRELGFQGLLPVGSVQTVLLYIVRERDRVIENFKPIPYYVVTAQLRHANGSFRAVWKPDEAHAGLDESNRLVSAEVADALVSKVHNQAGEISSYTIKDVEQPPPLPLAQDELQMEAYGKFGYDATTVLEAAQKLYETYKVTSYPRTTTRYLFEVKHAEAPLVLAAVIRLRPDLVPLTASLDHSRKSAAFSDAKMDGSAHHGIIPTVPESAVDVSTWSVVEKNVYDLIVRSYLAQFAPAYRYAATAVDVDIAGERFRATGKTLLSPGWKVIYAESEDDEPTGAVEDDAKQPLPKMMNGDAVSCSSCDLAYKKTTPPPRFDGKLLIDAMKNVYKYVADESVRKRLKDGDGIGTAATRAPMIKDLMDRDLIVPVKAVAKVGDKVKLMSSPAARALIDALPADVKEPVQAGIFKASLDRLSKDPSDALFDEFMRQTERWVTRVVKDAACAHMVLPAPPGIVCPTCKVGRLRRIDGSNGPFWSCSRWNAAPDKCAGRFNDANGKPDFAPKTASKGYSCKECGKPLRRIVRAAKDDPKGKGWDFWSCTGRPVCAATYQTAKNGAPATAGKSAHA